jgi:GTP cyclohydrolase II
LHGGDEDQEEDLEVELGAAEIAGDPAVDAEVDHGGEGPDVFGGGETSVHAGDSGYGEVDGEGEVLVVQEGGEGEDGASCHGGDGADEDAEEDGGLEGEVGGEEVLYGQADPDAEGQRDADHREESRGLAPVAAGIQEQAFECRAASEDGGERGGYSQLDEQGYQDQFGIGLMHTSTLRRLHRSTCWSNQIGVNTEPYNQRMHFSSVRKVADADFPSRWGHFRILGFEGVVANPESCNEAIPAPATRIESGVALVMGDIHAGAPIVRIHSQCLTGDVFHSLRCDCRQQLELALAMIAEAGTGILLYEQQEGRGIGLMAKLKAYELQDQGLDTIEANLELGYKADCRVYELPAEMLKLIGVKAVRLITNNPEKVEALVSAGIEVVERISAVVPESDENARYLETKRDKMGHLVG